MTKLILVTGSTGYVATRLVPALLSKGYGVRCLARNRSKLRNRPWREQVEIYSGDLLNGDNSDEALEGVDAAYYLVHNMASGETYRENERSSAKNFATAAVRSKLGKIIYLGGLGGSTEFRHMHSRQETGKILRESGIPTIEFRSSVIIGSGSISFEMIRYITTWFPFIPAPVQTNQSGQPIGIKDLLSYLLSALEYTLLDSQIVEIGGPQTLLYPDLMTEFARQRNLIRPKIFLPFFNATLSAQISDKLTPVPFFISKPLMDELTSPSIVENTSATNLFPLINPSTYLESVKLALGREEYLPNSPWTASLVTRDPLINSNVITKGEGLLIDHREKQIDTISRSAMILLDGNIEGGWVMEDYQPGKWIRIRSNRKLPGLLRLEIKYKDGILMQTVFFEPNSMPGFLWWYLLLPIHRHRFEKYFNRISKPQR
jgi:uncharacterized protein YbjT (DUF2867 family)